MCFTVLGKWLAHLNSINQQSSVQPIRTVLWQAGFHIYLIQRLTKGYLENRFITRLVLKFSENPILVVIIKINTHRKITHSGEVLVPSSDPEGPVGASVSEDHALRDRVAVDKSFVSLLLKARRVPALLHHLDGHLRHSELIPVGHLRRLMCRQNETKVLSKFMPLLI